MSKTTKKESVEQTQEVSNHVFQLGDKVEDLLSGLVGILGSRSIDLNGMVQLAVHPNVNEKGEANYVDAVQIKLVEAQVVPFVPVPEDVPDYMGCKVEHVVSGFKGIVTERVEYLNGCVRYCVQGKVDDKNPKGAMSYVPYQQLKVTKQNKVAVTSPEKSTGGPSRRVSDMI